VADASLGALTEEPALITAGGGAIENPAVDLAGTVSTDGSRIFWTDLTNNFVYVRENDVAEASEESAGHCTEPEGACTVQLSAGPATYETATPDGRYGYYTEGGQLWRFDLRAFNAAIAEDKALAVADASARTAVTPAGAEVQGVIGVNQKGEDGAYLYLVARAALASNKVENGAGTEEAQAGQPNLYLVHEGTLTFVATLLPGDDSFAGSTSGTGHPESGDWRPVLGYRSAEPSADGTRLIFMSNRQLTGYPNLDLLGASVTEIYIYDAASGHLVCASCNPSGALPPIEKPSGGGPGTGTFIPRFYDSATHQGRWISASGTRAFFNTNRALVPTDQNGKEDVYEWEAPGAGSCAAGGSAFDGGGCVYLLSGGAGSAGSFLIDTDEEGDNAFFVSRSPLAPTDRDGKPDLYDAREDGGFTSKPVASNCEAENCRGMTPSLPSTHSFATQSFGPSGPTVPTKCNKKQIKKHGHCITRPKPSKHNKKRHKKQKHRHHGRGGRSGGHK
jgi:hypothetical protein